VNRDWMRLVPGLALSLGVAILIGLPARAGQFSDGTTHFVQPPRLNGATATQQTAYFFGSTYYFTLTLPENAGEGLQRVVIAPEAAPDTVQFDVRQTEAFEGTRDRGGAKLPLQSVTQDPATKAITVTFDPAVAPGKTVTIGLYATRNPDIGGIYLYGVTAFPPGAQASGQFLGYGRIQILDSGADSSFNGQKLDRALSNA